MYVCSFWRQLVSRQLYVSLTHAGMVSVCADIILRPIIYSAILCQIGQAPLTHDTSSMGDASVFPTQIPMIASRSYDTAQLSRKSVLVPVLTGRLVEVFNILDTPKVRARFLLSDRACPMRNILGSDMLVRYAYDSTIFSSESSTVPRDIPYP